MTRSAVVRLAVAAVLVAATVSACAGSVDGASTTPSLTLAQSPTPSDVGPLAGFLHDPDYPTLATTPARDSSSFSGATFTVLTLRTDSRSTLLVWSATHPRTISAGDDFDVRRWRNFPVLNVKDRSYSVLTYETPTGETACVCADLRALADQANPQGALYPPLPDGVTSVTLSSPWFEDVTVPVTRS